MWWRGGCFRGIAAATGVLGLGASRQGSQQGGEEAASAGSVRGGEGLGAEANMVASLNAQLTDALAAAEKWQHLHNELQAFCVEHVLPRTGFDVEGG